MRTPPFHMNCGSHHEFNQWEPQLCESGEYIFMVFREYPIITLKKGLHFGISQNKIEA